MIVSDHQCDLLLHWPLTARRRRVDKRHSPTLRALTRRGYVERVGLGFDHTYRLMPDGVTLASAIQRAHRLGVHEGQRDLVADLAQRREAEAIAEAQMEDAR